MGGGAGHDFQMAQILKAFEAIDQVAFIRVSKEFHRRFKTLFIIAGQGLKMRVTLVAKDFLFGQLNQSPDIHQIACLQEGISQHRQQRGGHGHGHAKINAVIDQIFVHHQQGHIGFGNRFVEPMLFEKIIVFGVAHIGQMCVEYHRMVAAQGAHANNPLPL
jgi:hypothetical protein